MVKGLHRIPDMVKSLYIYIYIYIGCAALSLISCFLGSSSVFADNVNYSVVIDPSLTLTIPSSSVVLDLDPASKTYDSKSFPVSVATNNITGYKLSVSTTGDTTDLTRDISSDTTTLPTYIIPTLDSGSSYSAPSDFPANKWGYKKDSGNYIPFSSPTPLLENTTATNGDTTTLSFASKIDYTLASGAYKTTLIFTATTNPMVNYMQDLNPALCTTTPMTVVDKRDNEEYTIAKLADGNCWLLENLRLDISDPSVQAKLTSATTNATDETLNYLINGGGSSPYPANGVIAKTASSGSWTNSYNNPYIATQYEDTTQPASGSSPAGKIGIYYNFCAASAGSYCYAGNASSGNASQDICPSGWRMPTGGASGEYLALYTAYSSNVANFQAALSTPLSGNFYSGAASGRGTNGYFWSSTRSDGNSMYSLVVSSSVANPQYYNLRSYGFSVRCVLNDPRTISDITTMQEMSPQIVAKMNNGDTATLKDSRDGQDYTIAKLADGNVWLLENLRLDISDPTVQAKLTSATTNATDTTLGYLKNGGGTSPYPANGVSSVWSSSAQNSYDIPYIATAYKDDITTNYGSGSGKTGIYYNFCAASAGSYCYTSSTGTGNASQDICPLGWQIPTSEEYKTLSGKYNPTATSVNSLQYNLSTPLSGYFYNGKTGNYNLASIFWSSTSRGSGDMFDLAYNATSVIPQNYNTRDYGFNIRCIAK